jgi:integrase
MASSLSPSETARASRGQWRGVLWLASRVAGMLVDGVSLKVVSEVLGHASIGITGDIYGHVSPDVSREALGRL